MFKNSIGKISQKEEPPERLHRLSASICRDRKLKNDQFLKLRKVSGLIGLQCPDYGCIASKTRAIAQPPHRSIVCNNYHSLDHLLFVWLQNILSHENVKNRLIFLESIFKPKIPLINTKWE
ncbi:hypothetical protein DPV73_18050 [Leptospira mayottensis]|nr:hypothetical protein DPV73_18050 [Leptospira mayottensis]